MKTGKILHIIDSMDPKLGGVGQAVRTMMLGLAELGTYSEVLSLDSPESSFIKDDHFIIHPIGPAKGPWSYSPNLSAWLTNNFNRFDAVVLHGLWLYNGYATYKALGKFKKKNFSENIPRFFIMPHGMLDPYFQKASGRKFKALRNWGYWKLIESKLINSADGLLFTCEEERLLAHQPFEPYLPKKEKVVGLGVEEPPRVTPLMQQEFLKKCPELLNRPYFLFLGRVHEKKGVDLLIQAYKKLLSQVGNSRLEAMTTQPGPERFSDEIPCLVIAGPGLETSYGHQIQESVLASTILKDNVIFPDMLTGNAKWGAFYGCEAFILPSHQENFGIAVVEAMACGKAVLISNQINIWREIEEEGGGLIADDNLGGTFQLLQKWMDLSYEEKKELGFMSRSTYETCFAIQPNAIKLIKAIYAE